MNRGKIIILEGIAGCGKTTQLDFLKIYLDSKEIKYFYGREPGGSPIAEKIRSILLSPENKEMSLLTEVLLFEAARAEFFDKVVIPRIILGENCISDRSYFSTLAFQGYGRGFDLKRIEHYNNEATFGFHPDITYILDVEDVGSAVTRALKSSSSTGEKDRFEDEILLFHTKIRDGYRKISEEYSDRVTLIPHYENILDVAQRIIEIKNFIISDLQKRI